MEDGVTPKAISASWILVQHTASWKCSVGPFDHEMRHLTPKVIDGLKHEVDSNAWGVSIELKWENINVNKITLVCEN